MKRIALFPGSFDPFTNGHADIAFRASVLFDEVIIGVGTNDKKQRFFDLQMMLECIDKSLESYPNIRVESFQGLTAEFAKRVGASYLIRGLRNTTDFEYENTIAQVNQKIGDLETVLLITSPEYAYISSTIVRDIYKYKQNVDAYLPYKLR